MTALSKVARASRKAATARQERDGAIREAAQHHSLAEVAKAAGLTRGRIHQIVKAATLTTIAALTIASSATASSITIDSLASQQARRPVHIQCVTSLPWEGTASHLANGQPGPTAKIVAKDCRLVRQLLRDGRFSADSYYEEFYALDTVMHEATHLAGGPHWLEESWVECQALHATARVVRQLHLAGFQAWWMRFEWQHQPARFKTYPCQFTN